VNPGQIVQISEDNLPVEKIDLRTSANRSIHYLPSVLIAVWIYSGNCREAKSASVIG
jgi:hypothetical protein